MHKPAGSMLIVWPFAWSLTMSAFDASMPLTEYCPLVLYGTLWSILLHSAGCVWNDILDRDLDSKVERTKNRPIADGRISVKGALAFLMIQMIILLVALLLVNDLARNLGILTVIPFPGCYPLMKRITYWPQAWLGIAMNMVSLVAWAAVKEAFSPVPLMLLCSCWIWTMYYDTIYACQDRKDDLTAGIKSTAVLFGRNVKLFLALLAFAFCVCLIVVGILNGHRKAFYMISVGGTAVTLFHQVWKLNVNDANGCLNAFETNAFLVGFVVWLGIALDYLLQIL